MPEGKPKRWTHPGHPGSLPLVEHGLGEWMHWKDHCDEEDRAVETERARIRRELEAWARAASYRYSQLDPEIVIYEFLVLEIERVCRGAR